jgi:LacI family transcriptional regulator, galactose operon repressor
MGRVTIREVAERAGVSPATVSLVLSGRAGVRVSEATRRRVGAACEVLGYRPNSVARSLRTQRAQVIGVLSDEIASTPYAVRMVAAIEAVAREHGHLVFLVDTNRDPAVEEEAVAAFSSYQVDRVVYASMYHRVIPSPVAVNGRIVLCNARADGDVFPAVVPDEREGARVAVTELVAAGHRRIGFINDARRPVAAGLRLQGYRQALLEGGIAPDLNLVIEADASFDGGRQAAHRLLDAHPRLTGIFAFKDFMAAGVIAAGRERGLDVPEDLSVVGFDDLESLAAHLSPGLTTVALPHYEMGRWAASTLFGMESEPLPLAGAPPVLMPCRLVRRGSVRPPPGGRRSREDGAARREGEPDEESTGNRPQGGRGVQPRAAGNGLRRSTGRRP